MSRGIRIKILSISKVLIFLAFMSPKNRTISPIFRTNLLEYQGFEAVVSNLY